MTSDITIARARALADEIQQIVGITSASPDDWDDNDGFYILAYPARDPKNDRQAVWFKYPLHGLVAKMDKLVAKSGARLIWWDGPKMKWHEYQVRGIRYRNREGYNRAYYKLNVQF